MPGHGLVSAWVPITSNVLITAVDGVRNHILDLALELEQISPELGSIAGRTAGHREEVSVKFNQIIIAQHVQIGEKFSPNYGVSITSGDSGSLDKYLVALGVTDSACRKELVDAAVEARSMGEKDVKPDSKLRSAIRSVTGFASKTGAKATDLVIEAIIQKWLGG